VRDDLRTAFRSLRHSPAFTVVALTVLALGIGAGTAIFSVVDAVVLRGLPFDEHDRLGVLVEKDTRHAVTFGEGTITPQTYLDWRRLQQPFRAITAIGAARFRLKAKSAEPADATGQRVTAEFFPVLRVAPMIGRAFSADDEVEGRHRLAILSYGFWQRRYGGATDVLGRTIELSEQSYEVVGVMPRTFSYPVGSDKPSEILVPMIFPEQDRTKGSGHSYNYTVIGRLKDGVTFQQATDQMWRLSEQLDAQDPKWAPGRRMRIPLLKGRLLSAEDRGGSPLVTVINQAAAQKYWPGQEALGQHITISDKDLVVVGIVGNIHHLGPEIPPRQECYLPLAQDRQFGAALVIRTAGDPMAVLPAIKAAI
jgi:hypothetical protein